MKSGSKLLALLGAMALAGDASINEEIGREMRQYQPNAGLARWGAPIFQGRQQRKKKTNKLHRSRMLRKKHAR